jgi:hypothetical protein
LRIVISPRWSVKPGCQRILIFQLHSACMHAIGYFRINFVRVCCHINELRVNDTDLTWKNILNEHFDICCKKPIKTSHCYRPDVFENCIEPLYWTYSYYLINKILSYTSLDKNFITAWKSITKLVIFRSFFAKCCKMRII